MSRIGRTACCLLATCWVAAILPGVTPPDQYFDSDGVRIRYVDFGHGEPVVLVHGFTSTLESWNRGDIFQALARDYRVVAMDCRGHGKSDKPHDPAQYGTHSALDVLRLMDHLEIRRAHIVGYSMGARLTGWLLANHPDRFITATLGGSPPRPGMDEQRVEELSAYLRERSLNKQASDPQDYVALAASLEAYQTRELPTYEQLRSVDIPVLTIVGSEDREANINGLKALQGVLRSVEFVLIDGATHGQAVGRPEFLKSVNRFIASHAAKE